VASRIQIALAGCHRGRAPRIVVALFARLGSIPEGERGSRRVVSVAVTKDAESRGLILALPSRLEGTLVGETDRYPNGAVSVAEPRWSVIVTSSQARSGTGVALFVWSGRSRSRRRSWAFAATMIVEALIAIAPTAIGRSSPHGTNTPAATGIATRL